ncbi:MAG TPA: hypothetical protein VGM63_21435 [Mucilaginibacter sp.]|jgi:glycine cleavage system H protein
MQDSTATRGDLYFTQDHEWIDFQGFKAYVGSCKLLSKDSPQLPQIQFKENTGYQKKGKVIATIHRDNCPIPVRMPVDGRIIGINDVLPLNNLDLLPEHHENNEWMLLIEPSRPNDREGLMQIREYKLFCQTEILKKINDAHNRGYFHLHIGSLV